MKKIKNKLISFFYSTRDSLSLTISKIPIKLGEISMVYEIFSCMKKKLYKPRTKSEYIIIIGLIVNFILTILFGFTNYSNIEHSFFYKFILKSLFYFIFVFLIILSRKSISSNSVKSLCKIILITQIPFFILEYFFNIQIVGFKAIEPIQKIYIGSHKIYRFVGTASEPAYIVPLLAMPLYYFTNDKKDNMVYLILAIFYLIMTFSPFAFCILILNYAISLIRMLRKNKKQFINRICSLVIIFCIALIVCLTTPFKIYFYEMLNKMVGFLTGGSLGKMDWSATDRTQHLNYSIELFRASSLYNKIFGNGTGFYYFKALHNPNLLINDVEEAYNLYLSTLVDRGILGLINLILIFYAILSIKSKDVISRSIKFGIIVQFTHYFLVGNMWLYFLWIQVAILIAYNNYLKESDNCENLYTD